MSSHDDKRERFECWLGTVWPLWKQHRDHPKVKDMRAAYFEGYSDALTDRSADDGSTESHEPQITKTPGESADARASGMERGQAARQCSVSARPEAESAPACSTAEAALSTTPQNIDADEDTNLVCPPDVESDSEHFDAAGYDKNDCAGCGLSKDVHFPRAIHEAFIAKMEAGKYEYGRGPRQQARWWFRHGYEARSVASATACIPEGCTPADAMVLREANAVMAEENHNLRRCLRFYANGDHYTGLLHWEGPSGDDNWLCAPPGEDDSIFKHERQEFIEKMDEALVEDGSVARATLISGKFEVEDPADEPKVIKGEPEWHIEQQANNSPDGAAETKS